MQLWVFVVIDDASRKLLALVECKSPTTEASIEGMKEAMKHGKIKQCISDHGSQFIRIKHPQSNGKVEKFFDLYQNKRSLFKTKEEFIIWYNEVRPHRSLKFEELETPQQAFVRKMKTEV